MLGRKVGYQNATAHKGQTMNLSFKSCTGQRGKGLPEKREAPAKNNQQSACERADYKRFMFALRLMQSVIVVMNCLAFVMVAYMFCEAVL